MRVQLQQRCRQVTRYLGLLAVVAMLLQPSALAQLKYPVVAQLRGDSVLPQNVAEWRSFTLEWTNTSDRTIRCVPRIIVSKQGRILARTQIPRSRTWTLAPQQTLQLSSRDIFDELLTIDNGEHRDPRWKALADTGKLDLCLQTTDSLGIEHFAEPVCLAVRVFAYQLPIPLGPVGDDTLRTASVRFQWLPLLPERKATCYILRCYHLPDTLWIAEAVRQTPVLEQRVCNRAQLLWSVRRWKPGRYVWGIQAVDEHTALPLASSDGYSQWVTFVLALPPKGAVHQRAKRR